MRSGAEEVLESVFAKTRQLELGPSCVGRRLRRAPARPWPDCRDARGAVHVVLRCTPRPTTKRRPRVQANAHVYLARRQRLRKCLCGRERAWCGRKRKEEGVALGVPPRRRPSAAHASRMDPTVLRQRPPRTPSAPSDWRSFVEPSTSVKRKVTVPVGRSSRMRCDHPPAGNRRPVAPVLRREDRRVPECAGMSLDCSPARTPCPPPDVG